MKPSKNDEGALEWLLQLGSPFFLILLLYLLQRFGAHFGSAGLAAVAVVIAAIISGGLVLYLGRNSNQRGQIGAVVIGFMTLILVFGGIYYFQYRRDPSSFLFSGDGEKRRGVEAFSDVYLPLRESNRKLYLLALLEAHPEAGVTAISSDGKPIKIDNRRSVSYDIVPIPMGPSSIFFSIEEDGVAVQFSSNNYVDPELPLIGALSGGKDVELFLNALHSLIAFHENDRLQLLKNIERSLMGKDPWDFVDFVYFSAITMTTVGFGDIVPSSRTTRMLVLSQAIMGVSYVGFALAFLWPRRRETDAQLRC